MSQKQDSLRRIEMCLDAALTALADSMSVPMNGMELHLAHQIGKAMELAINSIRKKRDWVNTMGNNAGYFGDDIAAFSEGYNEAYRKGAEINTECEHGYMNSQVCPACNCDK